MPTSDAKRAEEFADGLTDAHLVAAARKGDADAFTLLMERYRLMAVSLALRLVPDGQTAQDIVQDAMLQAFLSLPQLRDPVRFKAWFYGIVLHVSYAARRPRRPQAVPWSCLSIGLLEWAELVGMADAKPDPAQLVEDEELRRAVREALAGISSPNRAALLLFYFEDMTHQAMARQLGISLAAVKSRLHKGRAQLRRALLASAPELVAALRVPAPSGSALRPRHETRDTPRPTPRRPVTRRTAMTPPTPTPSTPPLPPIPTIPMRIVRVIHAEPRVLVGLLDPQDARLLPLWLPGPEGLPLALLQKKRQAIHEARRDGREGMRQEADAQASAEAAPPSTKPPVRVPSDHPTNRTLPAGGPVGVDFVANLLNAFEATVEHIQIGELADRYYATVLVRGPAGQRPVQARLGEGLFAVLHYERPLLVPEAVVARVGVAVPEGSEPLDERIERVLQQLIAHAPRPGPTEPRIAQPRNLDFGQGLRHWELRGSFLLDLNGRHWDDYTSGIEAMGRRRASEAGGGAGKQLGEHTRNEQSAFLSATVPAPEGFADLRQGILADVYRGKRVRLAMVVKTEGVAQYAGSYVRIVDPERTRPPEDRQERLLRGTTDWTRTELTVDVPTDAVFLLFGISLTGPGKVWMAQVAVEEEAVSTSS